MVFTKENSMLRRMAMGIAVAALLASCGPPETAHRPSPIAAAADLGPGTVTSADGVEIAYTVHGLGTPALVLVHGWMCDQTHWDLQVAPLAERFGVVTVDLAGHGVSGIDREEWTVASLAQDVRAVIEKLGLDQVVVTGHSMGGVVGLEVARIMPGTVVGVLGVDALSNADADWDQEKSEQIIAAFSNDFPAACDSFVRSMFVEGSAPELVEPIVAGMCSGSSEAGAGLMKAMHDYDLAEGMRAAGVPIRCVNADLWPTDIEANRKYCDYDATVLAGHGHFLMQEAPEKLTQAMIERVLEMTLEGD
jgi:pimeloyl-ACP methyl ester carboxylesterase